MKKAFTVVEIIIVFLLILLTAYLTIPALLDDTKQAEYITKWKYLYSDMEATFFLIKEQKDDSLKQGFIANKNNPQKEEQMLIDLLRPYLRITDKVDLKKYNPYYLDSTPVRKGEYYNFENIFHTSNNNLVGIKWLGFSYRNAPYAIILYDVNGLKKPNTWGKDIFGMDLYVNSINPLGKKVSDDILQQNCSEMGKGTYCSYFYLIGGNFN